MTDIKVAIVAIARLENDYINEWIQHHLNIGVDHIYVYDNSSDEEEKLSGAVYEKFLNKVTIIPAYNKIQFQIPAYKEAYSIYGNNYDYLIYIDIDEFIMLQKDKDIKEFISKFPTDLECYRMNWELYGDSDIINRDVKRSVVEDFVKPAINQRNTTTKSIIKGGIQDIDFISVHYAIRNCNGVISNLKTYYGDFIDITDQLPIKEKSLNIKLCDYSQIKLNHYITKSLNEFICQKMRRPDAARSYDRNVDRDFFTFNKKTPEKVNFYKKSTNAINYYYYSPKKHGINKFENAGDYYNKVIINKLYYCICNGISNKINVNPDVAICGSILDHPIISNVKYILGCGFQNSKNAVNIDGNAYKAIRGKLTHDKLRKQGIEVSKDVKYVDAGLMVSKIYNIGDVPKKFKVGLIPHYCDEDIIVKKYGSQYKIISMKTTDILSICRQICECEIILSSSLHGIIFSHSLGIPAYHIELTKLMEGDNFKFKDYYSCYDRNIHYENFKCPNYIINVDDIIEYDKKNRNKCNPTPDEVKVKQMDFLSILPYKDLLNQEYIYNPVNKICVAMTSWKGRINNCTTIINNILSGTIVPEVYLTLSSDEFIEKEQELPKDLLDIIKNNKNVHLNWVKENTKCMKKVFPILQFLQDDDIILPMDDDILYPKDYIESRINEYKVHHQPISGHSIKRGSYIVKNNPVLGNFGGLCLFTKRMVKGWETYVSDEVIDSNNDDTCYAILQWLNGYVPHPCNKYDNIYMSRYKYNEVYSSHKLNKYIKGDELVKFHMKRIQEIYGCDYKNAFNIINITKDKNLNKKINTDTIKSKIEQIKSRNDGIRSSRRSMILDDISAGRIVKIPHKNGYVWKRIK